jgi:hypothetical protein
MGDHYVMGGDILLYKNDPYHQELIEQFGGTASRGVKARVHPIHGPMVSCTTTSKKNGFSDYGTLRTSTTPSTNGKLLRT